MEPVDNSDAEFLFCFIDELDHLQDELKSPSVRTDFKTHVIARFKEVTGQLITLKRVDNVLRCYCRDSLSGESTRGMYDTLFKNGSKAFPDAFLANLSYRTWVSRSGITRSAFTLTDLDSLRSKAANKTPRQEKGSDGTKRRATRLDAGLIEEDDSRKPRKATYDVSEQKRQKTSAAEASVPAQTRSSTLFSKGPHDSERFDGRTTGLFDGLESSSNPSGFHNVTQSMDIRKSSGPMTMVRTSGYEQEERDQSTALDPGASMPTYKKIRILFRDSMPRMAKRDVADRIKHIWYRTESFTGAFCYYSQVNECNQIELVIEPGDFLERVYKNLFGQEWQSNALRIVQSSGRSALNSMHGCLGASITFLILNEDLPWKGAKGLIADFGHLKSSIDQVLSNLGQGTYTELPNMESFMTLVAHSRVKDERFQQHTIESIADELSAKFMLAMHGRFKLLKATCAKKESKSVYHKQTRFAKSPFLEALILKGQLEASADEYSFCWVESGEDFDGAGMEEINEVKDDRCVAWCVFPKVVCKYKRDDFETLIAKAKVYTMAKGA